MQELKFGSDTDVQSELILTEPDRRTLSEAARAHYEGRSEQVIMKTLSRSDNLEDLVLQDVQDYLDLRVHDWNTNKRTKLAMVTFGAAFIMLGFVCMLAASVISVVYGELGPLRLITTLVLLGVLVSVLRRRSEISDTMFNPSHI